MSVSPSFFPPLNSISPAAQYRRAAPQTGEILGVQIVGPEAGELIHELIAVMYYNGTAADLSRMQHYHPTLEEIATYPAESIVERLGA